MSISILCYFPASQALGLLGKISYLRKIRDSIPKAQNRVFGIVETLPGQQIQVDMGEMRVDNSTGGQFKLYFCSFVLSFSRFLFVHCQTSPYKTEAFIDAHRQAFRYFGGLARECVYDQTKLVAIQEKYREVLFNEAFHQFSLKSGFHPWVCEGYDPQSKGKIERNIQEVKQGFLYGRVFTDLADLRDQLHSWLDRFNSRVHSRTMKSPRVLWEEEKALLKPVPDVYLQPQSRKADKTGLISYAGNKYSVPMPYQNRSVMIEEEDNMLHILDLTDKRVVATHNIPPSKGNIIRNNNHYRDFSLELSELKARTIAMFKGYDKGEQMVLRLVKDNPAISRDQLRAIARMHSQFDDLIWQQAIPIIHELPLLRATLIENILNNQERKHRIAEAMLDNHCQSIGQSALQRPLNEYMRAIDHDRNH